MKNYSKAIASAIKKFLTEDDWHFSFIEDKGIFRFGIGLKGKLKKIDYLVDVNENEYLVYALAPLGADERSPLMMSKMAEFVCRANYGLKNGCFELDMRDGEIRYKTFVPCDNITLSSEIIRRSIYCPASMFEQYSEGIISILFGDATAKEAIDKCESNFSHQLRSILSELIDDSAEDTMTLLAERLGFDDDKDTGEEDVIDEEVEEIIEVRTDIFSKKGGESL